MSDQGAKTSDLGSDMKALFEAPEFDAAIAQWPGNPQAGLAQLRPLADSGDVAANILVAALYPTVVRGMTGSHMQGVPPTPVTRRP